jgi:signal transduction histidine kinase/CheY-like chemotaxis protein
LDIRISTSTHTVPQWDGELSSRKLHADFVDAYGGRVFLALSAVGSLFLLPFSISHFLHGNLPLALTSLMVALMLVANAAWMATRGQALVPAWAIFAPALVSLAIAMREQGLIGILWSYAALLLFHFVLPRRTANVLNAAIIALAVWTSWDHLGPAITARVAATLALTLLFTNIFSSVTDAQRRRDLENRRRVDELAAQLQAQNAALREAIRVREEVERIARHDLKTPLASIASVPQLLREQRTPSPREEELLATVEHAAQRVLSMVNLSLDLYRMEEGSYRPRPAPVDLAQLARTVARELSGHADSKQVALRMQLPAAAPAAQGEELLCYSILANLMKNAVEAAPEGSAVRVTLWPAQLHGAGGLSLAIHNEGAVPTPVRASFFEKYATYGKAGGSGLGAFSARLMARVQGGELQLATGAAQGTTLTLWVPVWPGARHEPSPSRQGARRSREADTASLARRTVLLVDDDPYSLMVLRSLLPDPPFSVEVAINGRAALQAVMRRRFDAILMDLQMPVMGGREALERIRQLQRERAQAPSFVIAYSAGDEADGRRRCLDAGFDEYLAKGAPREELLALLRSAPAPQPAPAAAVAAAERARDEHVMALMPEFIASRRSMVAELTQAAARADREQVHLLAHTLAGSFGMYGFPALGDQARAIEKAAAAQAPEALRQASVALAAAFEAEAAPLVQPA